MANVTAVVMKGGMSRNLIAAVNLTLPQRRPIMEVTYSICDDYLIPDLVLSDTKEYHIGKYGRMRHAYLKEHHPILYTTLTTTEKLFPHLAEIDIACRERLEIIESAMIQQEGVTEALKAADQMEWVRCCNSIRNRAEEIILHELVYI